MFLMSVFSLAFEVYSFLSNSRSRPVILVDLSASGILAFLGFVAFCYLADFWRQTDTSSFPTINQDAAQAGIAFYFFSFILWVRGAAFCVDRGSVFEFCFSVLPCACL